MRLHRLHLVNFRQHRDTDLEFGTGLTGIIGHNGAGKSTLLEAIAWAIYGMDAESHKLDLQKALQHDLTPGGAAALLVFFAFAMQCMSTVAVVRRETGGWRWPMIQFAYMTVFAYVFSFLANRIVSLWF